jgi:hypothetical protein
MKIRVELTANFERNLDAIKAFWQECGAPRAYDDLLAELIRTAIPNLEQHPRFGRDFLARACGSIQAQAGVTRLRTRLRRIDPAAEMREYLIGDYLMLYAFTGATVSLLAIRHHRQLSFSLSERNRHLV